MTATVTPIAAPAAPAGTAAPAAPTPPVEKYRFDAFFQQKIAAMVLRDNAFMQRTDGLVLPEYFEDPAEAALVSIALRYYGKYKKIPEGSIYSTLIREDITNKVVRPELAKLMVTHMRERLNKCDISDRDYVIDQVATFARHQAVAAAMEQAIHKLDRKDFTAIEGLMKKALNVGAHVDIDTFDFVELLDRRTGERLDKAAGKLPPQGITTGYVAIDDVLYHKGWGRRELSVLMGGAKAGKTTALIDFGVNAWAAGFNVGYVTLEVSGKIICERMDANITEIDIKELHDNVHSVRSKVLDFAAKARNPSGAGSKFLIQEFPTGSLTVSDLRRLLERWKAKGTKIDLLIVDYADLMAPERHTDNAIENSKSVYVNLRGLAMMEDIGVLTATQTNREGYKAAVARAEHVSEDFNKIRIADIIISINRTDEERGMNQARLFFAACRNQEAGFTIRVEQAPNRMKFISKIMGFE
jgi:replicative DNA helicase